MSDKIIAINWSVLEMPQAETCMHSRILDTSEL